MGTKPRRVLGAIGIGLWASTVIALMGELLGPSHSVVSPANLPLSVALGSSTGVGCVLVARGFLARPWYVGVGLEALLGLLGWYVSYALLTFS